MFKPSMNRSKLLLAAALFASFGGASTTVFAQTDAARQERMDKAYEDSRNPNPGPAARTENSMKRGAHRAGSAVKHGAQSVGHAVGKGMRKTGEAVGRGGEKLEDKSTPKN